MQWDRSRTVHPGWLAVEFGTCVGVWTVVTFLLAPPRFRRARPSGAAAPATAPPAHDVVMRRPA